MDPLTTALRPGDRLGDFEIVRQLGEGGMGVVYLARDRRLGRQVALKVIAPRLAQDPEFQERFEGEARSAAAIEHPNVVPVYSAGSVNDKLFIAMRFIDGTDLRKVLDETAALGPTAATRILGDIAGALDAAHAAGLVHRDVKPANVLLAGELGKGSAYLTDFGLTRGLRPSQPQLTGTGQWIGTLDYVAPEQMAAGRVDARTDVYALGCVLYEMLAGTVPFPGNEMQKMWGKANEALPALPFSRPEHPLDPVVARATARDPEQRFRSAGDLARAAAAATGTEAVALTERSVATGAAAVGLLEDPAEAEPTRRQRPVQPPPPREQPTMPLPRPPSPRPPHERQGGLSGRTAAVIGGSLVLAAGLIAAALVVAGSKGGGESRTVVSRGITTTVSETAPADTVATSSEADPSSASPTQFNGANYSASVPAGWAQQEDEKVARDGSYVENTWAAPSGEEVLLIDASPGEPAPPSESVAKIAADVRGAGEDVYSVRNGVSVGSAVGSELDFRSSSGLPQRADFFFDRGDSGFAVLASANDLSTADRLLGPLVSSIRVAG